MNKNKRENIYHFGKLFISALGIGISQCFGLPQSILSIIEGFAINLSSDALGTVTKNLYDFVQKDKIVNHHIQKSLFEAWQKSLKDICNEYLKKFQDCQKTDLRKFCNSLGSTQVENFEFTVTDQKDKEMLFAFIRSDLNQADKDLKELIQLENGLKEWRNDFKLTDNFESFFFEHLAGVMINNFRASINTGPAASAIQLIYAENNRLMAEAAINEISKLDQRTDKVQIAIEQLAVIANNTMVDLGLVKDGIGQLSSDVSDLKNLLNQRIDEIIEVHTKPLKEKISELEHALSQQSELNEPILNALKAQIELLEMQLSDKKTLVKDLYLRLKEVDITSASKWYRQAMMSFLEGRIDDALKILNLDNLNDRERQIDSFIISGKTQLAEEYVFRGDMLEIEYRLEEAEESFLKALTLSQNGKFYFRIGQFYQTLNKFELAESYYSESYLNAQTADQQISVLLNLLVIYSNKYDLTNAVEICNILDVFFKELDFEALQTYFPYYSRMLNTLGSIQRNQLLYSESIKSYETALFIRRRMEQHFPGEYINEVATTLYNLGLAYDDILQHEKAETVFIEALRIDESLYSENPNLYEAGFSETLVGLAGHYENIGNQVEALKYYEEALGHFQELAKKMPMRYEHNLANLLTKLGSYLNNEQGKEYLKKAVEIYSRLQISQPEHFALLHSDALHNLGSLCLVLSSLDESEDYLKKALEMRRHIAKVNMEIALPNVAESLNNLGNLYVRRNKFVESLIYFQEAIEIRREFATSSPLKFEPILAKSLISYASLHWQAIPNQEEALAKMNEAIDILLKLPPFAPSTQSVLSLARHVLHSWDYHPDQYIKRVIFDKYGFIWIIPESNKGD